MAENTVKPESTPTGKFVSSGCSCVIFTVIGSMIFLIVVYFSLIAIGATLIVSDPIEEVDAVVVLSGGSNDRLLLAVDIHDEGYAPNLVITNTNRTSNALLRQNAINAGFPREGIYITDVYVDSTYDEAVSVREIAIAQGWRKLIIVTDPYHSFRTRLIFQRELSESGIAVIVRPVPGHWFQSTTWFYSQEGRRFVFLEILKMVNYLWLSP